MGASEINCVGYGHDPAKLLNPLQALLNEGVIVPVNVSHRFLLMVSHQRL
jgi:hypothetical protein